MIRRIVKLTFEASKLPQFLQVFEASKQAIRAFEGCVSMELLRDTSQENVLFTVSQWRSLHDLEAYRNSKLFKQTWAKTKVLFSDKAQAWSLEVIDAMPT
jgi:(4S)-4-hydroxy-5-phosphonooxypentane-2,3-dione isomerase